MNTLSAMKRLEGVGMARDQAEMVIEITLESIHASREGFATKLDLARMEIRMISIILVANGLLFAALKPIP